MIDIEPLDHEPLVVEIERPICACPLVPDACTCPREGVALWE